MRRLLPPPTSADETASEVDLVEFYSRDWLGRGGIRANMVASMDGAVSVDGTSGGLQTPGDNAVYAVLRELADAVMAGSATVAAEDYGPVRLDDARRAERRARGLVEDVPIVVVSRSLRLDLDARLFAGSRPIVVTTAAADPEARARVAERADVLSCGEDDIDYALVRAALAERGLRHVLCEGGPTILSRVALAGQLDELCLSLSPVLAGPGAGRILGGHEWPGGSARRLELTGLLEDDGALFARLRPQAD